jgi:hypothetical protein
MRLFRRFVALPLFLLPRMIGALTYPGPAPCDTTLQACIDGAAPGDTIEIATNTPIPGNLTLARSLTLRPAAGFTPTIGVGAVVQAVDFSNLGTLASPETLVIEGLRFQQTQVRGLVSQGAEHNIVVRDNVFFLEIDHNNTPAIEIDARVPLTGTVAGNQITSIGQGVRLMAITDAGLAVDYTVERNRINTSLPSESNVGILFDLRGAGTYQVRAFSNVVDRVAGCNCGGNAGISVLVLENPVVVASLTNNTVHGTQTATAFDLSVRTVSADVTFNLFNNIASQSDHSGFRIDNDGSALALAADANDSFANGQPDDFLGLPAGTVLDVDPQYVDAAGGNLRLQPYSPLINVGVDLPPGGTSDFDADGAPRILGPQIDIGAYEQAERLPPPLSIPAASGPGLAALVFLLALFAFAALRRRQTAA